jgi:hypothetical protein
MAPASALGRFVIHRVLRRPRFLGSITYHLWPETAPGSSSP